MYYKKTPNRKKYVSKKLPPFFGTTRCSHPKITIWLIGDHEAFLYNFVTQDNFVRDYNSKDLSDYLLHRDIKPRTIFRHKSCLNESKLHLMLLFLIIINSDDPFPSDPNPELVWRGKRLYFFMLSQQKRLDFLQLVEHLWMS